MSRQAEYNKNHAEKRKQGRITQFELAIRRTNTLWKQGQFDANIVSTVKLPSGIPVPILFPSSSPVTAYDPYRRTFVHARFERSVNLRKKGTWCLCTTVEETPTVLCIPLWLCFGGHLDL